MYDYWIDSHCHLDFAADGAETLIDRARLNRVGAMLTISTHTHHYGLYVALADQFTNVWTTIGVHPHQADEEHERDIKADTLIDLATNHPRIVAIGECGLDYHYDYAPREQQKKVFREHIKAAVKTGLPLVIHSRNADDDMIDILKENGAGSNGLKAVMHCFSSGQKLAEYALEAGFYISFSGILTFPKANDLHEICKSIPLERILVETDAPYLAPVPYRGKRNEPAYVSHTGRYLAKLHEKEELEVMNQTTSNFFNLFNKIKGSVNE